MPRIECPACGQPDRVADRDVGREVECRRCRTAFFAEPATRRDDRSPPPTDGSGFAVWSLVLGIGSVLTAIGCGVGAIFGIGGLIAGSGGLQSRRRGVSIAGLVLSLSGIILSIGAFIVEREILQVITKPVPPKPDGTQPPFARSFN